MRSTNFRQDINGLRAWAVVLVVLFHFGIPGFSGGFAGVDVFFVISGYLMTGIILSGLDKGAFSLWRFYEARARRILPALLCMCLVLLAIGWKSLITSEYQQLATHVLSAMLFVSNAKFWLESGYFDAASHEKWLLHTWSLSVEWQFYLLLPLILMIALRLASRRGAIWAIMSLLALSLVLSIYCSVRWPSSAYFMLHTRAWEMLAGGIVWWCCVHRGWTLSHRKAKAAEVSGFILIILSATLLDASHAWPGYLAVIPVVGAMLVLLANCQQSAFTSTPIAQWLGSRSYSIYLWHWPVCVLLYYTHWYYRTEWVLLGIALALILGELSFRLVEEPSRKLLQGKGILRPVYSYATAIAVIMVSVLGIRLYLPEGRIPQQVEVMAREASNTNPYRSECGGFKGDSKTKLCSLGGDTAKAILIGDSHADAVMTAMLGALPSDDAALLSRTMGGCPTILGARRIGATEQKCQNFNRWLKQTGDNIDGDLPMVIVNRTSIYAMGPNELHRGEEHGKPLVYFSARYDEAEAEFLQEFREGVVSTLCDFAQERQVYVMRPIPEMYVDVPKAMTRSELLWNKRQDVGVDVEDYHARHAFTWSVQDEAAKRCGVKILDPLPYLCRNGFCAASKQGRPLYFDANHLSEFGNQTLIPMFKEIFSVSTPVR